MAIAAIWRLRDERLVFAVFIIAAGLFLIWYFRVEKFATNNPLEALLEGGEYTAHHQMLLAAKGQPTLNTSSGIQKVANPITAGTPVEEEQGQ